MNQSSKKERLLETIQQIINLLPAQNKLIITAFFPQFRLWLDELEEEKIDYFLSEVKKRVDYIENGYEPTGE